MASQSSSLEQLAALIDKQVPSANIWRDMLPTLRAQASATSAVLTELAHTPPSESPPHREYVDIVLAAPSKDWAEDVARWLRHKLPAAQVALGSSGERLPDAPPPPGYTVRCEVSLPGYTGKAARGAVLAALGKMAGIEVDYSEPIDLIVVAPKLNPPVEL